MNQLGLSRITYLQVADSPCSTREVGNQDRRRRVIPEDERALLERNLNGAKRMIVGEYWLGPISGSRLRWLRGITSSRFQI
jgi:hypothetical protein